jgi:hypothetical protein
VNIVNIVNVVFEANGFALLRAFGLHATCLCDIHGIHDIHDIHDIHGSCGIHDIHGI